MCAAAGSYTLTDRRGRVLATFNTPADRERFTEFTYRLGVNPLHVRLLPSPLPSKIK